MITGIVLGVLAVLIIVASIAIISSSRKSSPGERPEVTDEAGRRARHQSPMLDDFEESDPARS